MIKSRVPVQFTRNMSTPPIARHVVPFLIFSPALLKHPESATVPPPCLSFLSHTFPQTHPCLVFHVFGEDITPNPTESRQSNWRWLSCRWKVKLLSLPFGSQRCSVRSLRCLLCILKSLLKGYCYSHWTGIQNDSEGFCHTFINRHSFTGLGKKRKKERKHT